VLAVLQQRVVLACLLDDELQPLDGHAELVRLELPGRS
jgi:hypothetical protein